MSKHSATYYSCLLDLAAVPMLADRPWRVVLPRYATIIARDTIIAPYSRFFLSFSSIVSFLFPFFKTKGRKKKSRCETTPGCVSFREIYGIIKVCCDLWSVVPIMKRILFLFPFLFLLEGNETSFNRSSIYPRVNAFKWRELEKGLSLMEADD